MKVSVSDTISHNVTLIYRFHLQISYRYTRIKNFLRVIVSGCSGLVDEYRIRNREVAGLTHTRSTASNLEQVANLLCAQLLMPTQPPTLSGTGNE